jgi:TonB family protein
VKSVGSLLFDWPGRHSLQLVLPATIVLAALVHAGIFFLFAIAYPAPQSDGVAAAQAFLTLPGSPDAARLKALVEGDDPAVFAPGRGLGVAEIPPAADYRPSYASTTPRLSGLPEAVGGDALPAGAVPVPENSVRLARAGAPAARPAGPPRTSLSASGALGGRTVAFPEGVVFEASPRVQLDVARFLVAVEPDGTVDAVFLQGSSGSADLDAAAGKRISGLKFEPAPDAGVVWDVVAVHWGADVRRLEAQ